MQIGSTPWGPRWQWPSFSWPLPPSWHPLPLDWPIPPQMIAPTSHLQTLNQPNPPTTTTKILAITSPTPFGWQLGPPIGDITPPTMQQMPIVWPTRQPTQ